MTPIVVSQCKQRNGQTCVLVFCIHSNTQHMFPLSLCIAARENKWFYLKKITILKLCCIVLFTFNSCVCLFFLFFADTMWSIVQVTESGTLALTQQLSELRTNNTADIPMPKPTLEVNQWTLPFLFTHSYLCVNFMMKFYSNLMSQCNILTYLINKFLIPFPFSIFFSFMCCLFEWWCCCAGAAIPDRWFWYVMINFIRCHLKEIVLLL